MRLLLEFNKVSIYQSFVCVLNTSEALLKSNNYPVASCELHTRAGNKTGNNTLYVYPPSWLNCVYIRTSAPEGFQVN